MSKEAMKLGLEALEMYCEHGAILRPIETRDAIKEALAKQSTECVEQGEPLAVMQLYKSGWDLVENIDTDWLETLPFGTKLYTTPQPKQEQRSDRALADSEQLGEPVGVMVSMDVSKGDEPEHRIFGRIYEVQEDGDGVTYLAIEDSRNFEAKQEQGTWYAAKDIDHLVKTLDVAMNGLGAAQQAKLCDLVNPLLELIAQSKMQGEPVGEVESSLRFAGGFHVKLRHTATIPEVGTPLYTTPYVPTGRKQPKPLTDEQIWESNEIMAANGTAAQLPMSELVAVVRAVEATHGIKD